MGVKVSDTNPETRIATEIVIANSWKRRPINPLMKMIGINTATNESVIEIIVKLISRDPLNAASIGSSPSSRCRTIFSRTTIASSTTNPTESVNAINDRLFRENPNRYMTANVPIIAIGNATLGIKVAPMSRKNTNITRITKAIDSSNVNFTSSTDARIVVDRS